MNKAVSRDVLPALIQEVYDFLTTETGVEPVVERTGYGRMLMTHQNDRVRVTISLRLSGKAWNWTGSKLYIDGESAPRADDREVYVSIFKDPDDGRRNHVPKGAKQADLPESRPVEEDDLPSEVRSLLKQAVKTKAENASVTLTTSVSLDRSQHFITLKHLEKGSRIVVSFKKDINSTPGWSIDDMIAISSTGYDVTGYLHQPMDEYLMDMLGADSRAKQVPFVPGGRTEGAAVTNSVTVRKSTVFRI